MCHKKNKTNLDGNTPGYLFFIASKKHVFNNRNHNNRNNKINAMNINDSKCDYKKVKKIIIKKTKFIFLVRIY
jgi:hypothetical protein